VPTGLWSLVVFLGVHTPRDCRLADREAFPPREVACGHLRAAREYRGRLEEHLPLGAWRYESWRDACRNAVWRFECWDWLHAAQGGEARGPDYWLHSLRELRRRIGDEAYFRGVMPPPYDPSTP
jgi:hypothetical protein